MKRYFFSFFNGSQWSHDTVGQSFSTLKDVRKEARHALVQLSEDYCLVNDAFTLVFIVVDEEGKNVCKIKLFLSEETSISVD